MKDTLGNILPSLTDEQKEMIKGSCDFFVVDPYLSFYVSGAANGIAACAANSSDPNWPTCADFVPELLNCITKELYSSIPDIFISAFGFVEPGEGDLDDMSQILWDLQRADYLQRYLDNVLTAIFDNREWFSGKRTRFGLQHVNYSDPNLTRSPKASMFQFLDWFGLHGGATL
ncbi:glycoside hydrolase family 1 protein [Saccharata proteae CBS 121410]|uniref:Glycoside hydrolase family 1 protein n=1 Tax=Saccharata proteae CBS 121410 TaxID=1314787 RepID=A0A9P4HR17_9PEZI|nr:glycoside hydrolase family 1 protein [Saccharata proteae CBS 121410]